MGGLIGGHLLAADPGVRPSTAPPEPPVARPPVQFFLELLAAAPARRDQLLATKSGPARELILRRIREFEALPAAARDEAQLNLRLAEFRFYLSPLLSAKPADRAALLAHSPEVYRPILSDRMLAWDALTPDARRQLLESEQSLHYFIRQETADPGQLSRVLAAVPAQQRSEVEDQFTRWKALSDPERARRTRAFEQFFGLGDRGRDQVLGRMNEPDRRAMEITLKRYAGLPAAERERCLQSFDKLAHLSVEERGEFLRNAARWQVMTPEERTAWRRLVLGTPLPPPLPPMTPTTVSGR